MVFDPQMLRLECFKLAHRDGLVPEVVIEEARKIEAYILGAVDPTDRKPTPLSRIMEAAKTVDPRSVIGLK